MVIGYHVILGMYGFWLPNDPRGSWSDFVGSWELFLKGRATKVETRESLAASEHDARKRLDAKNALKYPPVVLTGLQARAIGTGFGEAARKSGYIIHACSILPEHVHLVIRRHDYHVEQIIRRMKQAAGLQLRKEGIHPLARYARSEQPPPGVFAERLWKCFIDSEAYPRYAIQYVEQNPAKEGVAKAYGACRYGRVH